MEEKIREEISGDKIRETIAQLNSLLGESPYKLDYVNPRDIKLLDKNAHYMPHEMFQNLVSNIKHDKALASFPLCYKDDTTPLTVLSGNHRVQAAAAAGLAGILILVIDRQLSRQEQVAIQLSHNALHGKDDPVILKDLWDEIEEIDLKLYSGLDTEVLKELEKMEFTTISDSKMDYKQIMLLFLSEEQSQLQQMLDDVDAFFIGDEQYILSREHYDSVFRFVVDIKDRFKIINNPTAFMKIIEMAREYMATLPPPEPKKKPIKNHANSADDNSIKSTT